MLPKVNLIHEKVKLRKEERGELRMEIRKLEIDLDAGILKINGKDFTERQVVVSLPGLEGWTYRRLFNFEHATEKPGKCDELTVNYSLGET